MADLGQVFTNGNVAKYMVSLFDLPKQAEIMDPCYGAGSFLKALASSGYSKVTACEMDKILFESTKSEYSQYQLINGDFLKVEESNIYDGIIMNPPYIRQEKIDELKSYGITKENLRSKSIFSGLPSTANMYMYFIMKAIDLLKDGGQLIVIFPSSWMNARSGAEFQNLMLSKCGLERQIHIYGDIFEQEALVEVSILKLVKGRTATTVNEEYLESNDGKLVAVSAIHEKKINLFSYPFSELATIKRGLTTGCNEMYINPDLLYAGDDCFRPIVSSPKSIEGYTTINARLDRLFFPIDEETPAEVLEYLKFWKNKIIKEQKPKTLYMKVNRSDRWYELREICGEGILFGYFVRNDMKFVMNETGVLVRDNFYVIKPKVDKWVLFALLNNYYTYYQLELSGKRYGAGLLKLQRYDLEALTFPEYVKISTDDKKELERLSRKLLKIADASVVHEITAVISKYSNIACDEITDRYFTEKSKRLEVK